MKNSPTSESRLFAISDLHLPAGKKPMDVFGPHWERHFERICDDWRQKVTGQDVVVLPGDLTWAMQLEEAAEDLARVSALPGRKVLLRGNHDYWWSSIGRVRRALPEGMYALQNDCLELENWIFAGTRGWLLPQAPNADASDEKIYRRERARLTLSLDAARRLRSPKPIVALMHYPPRTQTCAGFADLLSEYGVRDCIYGHLHGGALSGAIRGACEGVWYHQVSCDGLNFQVCPVELHPQL